MTEIEEIKQEIAKLNKKMQVLIEVVYELSEADFETSGQLLVPYETREKIQHLKYKDASHIPIGER